MSPNVMLFDEPTRGIDVGAKAKSQPDTGSSDAGVAVLMISSDMEEVIGETVSLSCRRPDQRRERVSSASIT
jgi:ABC-type sugar transport system ATPase subunit